MSNELDLSLDERLAAARMRDNAVTERLLQECARLVAVDQQQNMTRSLSLDTITQMLRPARYHESGRFNPNDPAFPHPENGSFAYQLFSAIMFAVDARAELKMLEILSREDFFVAMSRSAAQLESAKFSG